MKIFTIISFFLFVPFLFSQNVDQKPVNIDPDVNLSGTIENIDLSGYKLEGPILNSSVLPASKLSVKSRIQEDLDTLYDYYDRASGFTSYGISINNQNFPMTGWNPLYHILGSRYDMSGEIMIKGFLVAYSVKAFRGAVIDTIVTMLFECPNLAPEGTSKAMGRFTINDIDTNSTTPVFTPIMFDSPGLVTTNFACMVSTFDGTNEYDATVIMSNLTGDANSEQTPVILIFQQGGGAQSGTLAQLLSSGGMNDPNIDLMILPIIDFDVTGVDDKFKYGDLTISGISPNPATDFSTFAFSSETEGKIDITLVDNNGRKVKDLYTGDFIRGNNSLHLDFSDVASGTYYLTVIQGRSKFAANITIIK